MKYLKTADEKLEEVFLIGVLAVMVVVVFMQICMRYAFKASLPWSEELARYLFLWLIWVGAAYATKKNRHISIDFIKNRLPKTGKKVVNIIAFSVWLVFAMFLLYISFHLTGMIMERGQVSAAMRLPMWIAYASIPCGMFLMIVRMVQNFIINMKTEEGDTV